MVPFGPGACLRSFPLFLRCNHNAPRTSNTTATGEMYSVMVPMKAWVTFTVIITNQEKMLTLLLENVDDLLYTDRMFGSFYSYIHVPIYHPGTAVGRITLTFFLCFFVTSVNMFFVYIRMCNFTVLFFMLIRRNRFVYSYCSLWGIKWLLLG